MKVRVKYDEDRNRWVIDYLLPTGTAGRYQRKRKFFTSESAANEAASGVKRLYQQHGASGLSVDPHKWKRYQFLEGRLAVLNATLEQAVEHYLKAPPDKPTEYLETVVGRFVDHKDGKVTRRWHRTIVNRLFRFHRAHPAARIGDITHRHVEMFMGQWESPESRANIRRMLYEFFAWAKLHGYVTANAVELVPVPRVVRDNVSLMPMCDAGLLLSYCNVERPELLPFIALRMFAGLRTTSAERIDWSEIKVGESIEVPAVKAKNRKRMYLTGFPSVLWDWLRPHARPNGRVGRSHYNVEVTGIARDLGVPFPKNVLRHSFATYHLAAYRNLSETVLLLGHRSSPRVLWEHYNGRASKEDGLGWFALTPQLVATNFPWPRVSPPVAERAAPAPSSLSVPHPV